MSTKSVVYTLLLAATAILAIVSCSETPVNAPYCGEAPEFQGVWLSNGPQEGTLHTLTISQSEQDPCLFDYIHLETFSTSDYSSSRRYTGFFVIEKATRLGPILHIKYENITLTLDQRDEDQPWESQEYVHIHRSGEAKVYYNLLSLGRFEYERQ